MPTKMLYERIKTTKPPEEVRKALIYSYRPFGGTLQYTQDGFNYFNGKAGISNSSTANISSNFIVRKTADDIYEVQVMLHWSMSEWSIACIILGLFIFLFWIVPILYFSFDPQMYYQQALARVQYILEPQTGLRMN